MLPGSGRVPGKLQGMSAENLKIRKQYMALYVLVIVDFLRAIYFYRTIPAYKEENPSMFLMVMYGVFSLGLPIMVVAVLTVYARVMTKVTINVLVLTFFAQPPAVTFEAILCGLTSSWGLLTISVLFKASIIIAAIYLVLQRLDQPIDPNNPGKQDKHLSIMMLKNTMSMVPFWGPIFNMVLDARLNRHRE
jgi:hypothetical protein